jgi:hypothetical protein
MHPGEAMPQLVQHDAREKGRQDRHAPSRPDETVILPTFPSDVGQQQQKTAV